MIYVGIDVAKDKHDCFLINSEGETICTPFQISNNIEGFNTLYEKIKTSIKDKKEVKVGLESTGHYGFNLLDFLNKKNLKVYVINPLHTTLYRKSMSLRQAKTDPIDTRSIASMLMSNVQLKEYKASSEDYAELKSLCRYRYDKVREKAKLKVSVSRLVTILFPELENLVSKIHNKSIYILLMSYPGASRIARANLSEVCSLLKKESKGHYKEEKAEHIWKNANKSIAISMSAKELELKHTLRLILEIEKEIKEIEEEIKKIMDKINSPILSIPGISYAMGAMIIGEIGEFSRFSSAEKIVAYAGIAPSVYKSGKIQSNIYSHMEKRGSKYLRYALFNAARFVCMWDETFKDYLNKKKLEGKPYKVAVSHASKKLVRVIYSLEKNSQTYQKK